MAWGVRKDKRNTGVGFRLRSWLTRRAMQRHVWKAPQHGVGVAGISRTTLSRLRRGGHILGVVVLAFIVYSSRDMGEYNILTPLHLVLADMGAFPHHEIIALSRVGESSAVYRSRTGTNARGYFDSQEESNAPNAPNALSVDQFGTPASLTMIPKLRDRVTAPKE